MKQMGKRKFQSPCVCRNELFNPRCLTVSVNSATWVEDYIRHTQGWLKTDILTLYT